MSISKFRLGIRGAIVILIAVFALASIQPSVHSQLGGLPQSPADSTVNPQQTVLTDVQKDAAFTTLFTQGNLQAIGKTVGMDDPVNEWTHKDQVLTKEKNPTTGAPTTNFRLSQVFKGIKVHNGNLTMSYADGANSPDVSTAHIDYVDDPQVDTTPKLSQGRAKQIAKKLADDAVAMLGGPAKDNTLKSAPDRKLALVDPSADDAIGLEIHPGGGKGNRKLSWHTTTKANAVNGPVQMEAWIDQDGNVLEAYNNAQSYVIGGEGHTVYQGCHGPYCGGVGVFNVDYNASYGGAVMNDNSLLIGVYDNYQGGNTYQTNQCCSYTFGNYFFSNYFSSNADLYATTVQTLSWMYYVLGRDFVDGARGPRLYNTVTCCNTLITARNHVNYYMNNAFWNGNSINIGDGDYLLGGNTFSNLSTLDIVGHEWQHGVTQYTAGLNYSGESGALNEAFSDIMGSMTERYWRGESNNYLNADCTQSFNCKTWKIGEEAWTPRTPGDALRYMDEPWRGGQPWYYFSGIGSYDPHYGSGAANFAFFVTAKGWPGVQGGVGADAARWVYYHALRDCMISTDGFGWARRCTQIEAAYWYGYGSSVYNAVRGAWAFIGAPGGFYDY